MRSKSTKVDKQTNMKVLPNLYKKMSEIVIEILPIILKDS